MHILSLDTTCALPVCSVTLPKTVGPPEVVTNASVTFAYASNQTPVLAAFPKAAPSGGTIALSGRLVCAPSSLRVPLWGVVAALGSALLHCLLLLALGVS
jgi:hypothetical protein